MTKLTWEVHTICSSLPYLSDHIMIESLNILLFKRAKRHQDVNTVFMAVFVFGMSLIVFRLELSSL